MSQSARGRATRICRHLTPAATDSAVRNKYPSRTGSVQLPIELHGYQRDFLDNVAASSLTPPLPPYLHPFLSSSRHEALQSLIELVMSDEDIRSEVFGDFHCVHCGGVNPADWINKHKGDKQAHPFELSNEVVDFLGTNLLVPVDRVGEHQSSRLSQENFEPTRARP